MNFTGKTTADQIAAPLGSGSNPHYRFAIIRRIEMYFARVLYSVADVIFACDSDVDSRRSLFKLRNAKWQFGVEKRKVAFRRRETQGELCVE